MQKKKLGFKPLGEVLFECGGLLEGSEVLFECGGLLEGPEAVKQMVWNV